MPPVYSVDKVASAVVRAARAPKDEIVIGRIGKAMVRQHRVAPRPVEAQMAVMVEKTHLSPTVPAGCVSRLPIAETANCTRSTPITCWAATAPTARYALRSALRCGI